MARRPTSNALCVYPAGGELCLAVCIAASSVLNRSGAALRASDLGRCLDQLTSTVATQLPYIRTGHRVGMDAQPHIDQLCEALSAVPIGIPDPRQRSIAGAVVGEVCTAVTGFAGTNPRPVEGCCQFALTVTEGAYGERINGPLPKLRFEIQAAESELSWHHGAQSKVAGATTLRDRPAATSVGLTLSLNLPWRDALDAIPYVLLHECVAHAFRGPGDSTKDTGQGSEFAEGWMDRVALLLFLRAVRSGKALRLPWPWSTVADIDERVTTVSKERRSERDPDPHERLRSRWCVGQEAALEVEGVIRRILRVNQAKATKEFIRLSLLLNASDITPEDRDRMARRIHMATHPSAPGIEDELRRHVEAWLRDGLPPPPLLGLDGDRPG
jgi:hypothetical protein